MRLVLFIFCLAQISFEHYTDIRIAVLNVSSTIWAKVRLHINTESLGKSIVDIKKVFTATIGNIESLASGFMRCQTSLQVCLDNILDICEVAALTAISVDRRHFAVEKLTDKLRYNRCI